MKELKQIPICLTKSKIYKMYAGEKRQDVEDAIRIAKQLVNKEKFNKYDKVVSYREFKYIVAMLDNPRGYVEVLNIEEKRILQKEITEI